VYLSLGSNIEREKNIRSALCGLEKQFGTLIVSPVYECPAVGFSGDNFYNLAVGFDSDLTVGEIAAILRKLEDDNGRIRGADKFAPRTLDIDLLTYGDIVGVVDSIELPRDEILKYAFVLKPLADVAAKEKHPLTGNTYNDHWQLMSHAQNDLSQIDFVTESI
jgi:2-amino-4-hydroxy-6-hydroxymethyldihydropteridine diphosphokinase